ncbi:MAG TPA: T9SS type A sorting domain-containing protein [Parafilimonas sp.]|nr:T9SS type A sorting domain-containing protein [Parafilimonas sp.]
MKTFLFSIQLLALCGSLFSQQCPQSIMKIQSPICDTPQNLEAAVACTSARLTWKGNKEQTYIVQATTTDEADNIIFETKQADYTCNNNVNCTAAIVVKEGEKLNWNVQAVCNINDAIIYSPVVEGRQTIIPSCRLIAVNNDAISKNNTAGLKVYPNPTTGYLTVEYNSSYTGNARLAIYDLSGKQIFSSSNTATKGKNLYGLNLANLSQGTYYLELNNASEHRRIKFVIER